MPDDLIVSEVRLHRSEILARFGGSMDRHHREIERTQVQYGERLVTLEPKRLVRPAKPGAPGR